ncbi:MAG TPA: hypothetical protein VKS01_03120, partial [Bryobacteraceae bacterium]|nr:hypothetical protein [Bryobacteraceae bacterium]
IKGNNLATAATGTTGTSFTVNADGTVSSTLAEVQVLFDNTPGTPTFVSTGQINVIAPWELATRSSTNVVVMVNGISSAATTLGVNSIQPGVYTLSATGQGQASAIDVSTGQFNGPATGVTIGNTLIQTFPAAGGSFISVFGTGGGVTNPPGVDGTLNSGTQLMPFVNWTQGSNLVTATIGGLPATVQFAGAAPTLITGVWQLNIQIPNGLASGPEPLLITINGQQTQSNVTVNVR